MADEERATGHSTFWRKKNEKVFVENYDTYLVELPVLKEIRREWRTNEYEYFRCNRTKKIVMLTSWDYDYCPFCGEKVKEKVKNVYEKNTTKQR